MTDARLDLESPEGQGSAGRLRARPMAWSALFEFPEDVAEVRARLAAMLSSFFPNMTLTDMQIWEKLTAAEAEAERRLRVFFGPVELIPLNSDLTTAPPTLPRWREEPGYDYTPDDFMGNRWGMFTVRHRPIIEVTKFTFYYPTPGMGAAFDVPLDWVRPDKKYGRINLVPTSHTLMMPLNAYILSVIGGGRIVPLMLQVRYKAGLTNTRAEYPDLADLVIRMAGYRLLQDLFLPSSGSVSADGLSQSNSYDFKSLWDSIENQIEHLRQAIQGIRFEVF